MAIRHDGPFNGMADLSVQDFEMMYRGGMRPDIDKSAHTVCWLHLT